MQQNTQPSDFFFQESFFLHSNYLKTVWLDLHILLPNKSTQIKETNTSPERLSETMTQQTSCFFKWKQIASTPLPLTYNDRKRLTRSALESSVGCWVTVLFNNTVQRTHPFLVQSYDKHVLCTGALQKPTSILVNLELSVLNYRKAAYADTGLGT